MLNTLLSTLSMREATVVSVSDTGTVCVLDDTEILCKHLQTSDAPPLTLNPEDRVLIASSPDTATPEDLRAFQLDMSENGTGSATFNNRLSVLGFFFSVICAREIVSSALVGSSSTSNLGRNTMARAMAIRWRCPPENSCG